jgi:hypothetical protein
MEREHQQPVETTLRTDARVIARVTDGIYRQLQDAPDAEYEAGKVLVWREPASDVLAQGTTIILDAIRPHPAPAGRWHDRREHHRGRGTVPVAPACGPPRQRHSRAASTDRRQPASGLGRDVRRGWLGRRTAGQCAGIPAVASAVAARRRRQPASRQVPAAHHRRGGSRLGPAPGASGRTPLHVLAGPLHQLSGSDRFCNLLERNGFAYVEEVAATPEACWFELRNCGPGSSPR